MRKELNFYATFHCNRENETLGDRQSRVGRRFDDGHLLLLQLTIQYFTHCELFVRALTHTPRGGGGVLPYKALMGTCGQPGYVFRDFCLEQGIEFIIFVLIRVTIYQFLS